MNDLTEAEKAEIIAGQIREANRAIFENELNLVKWAAMDGDWSNQIAYAEQAIANDRAVIEALSAL